MEELTTKQVAEALRVSESSVKRWCNGGAIHTVRTVGGHRRIPLDALLSFLERTNRRIESPLLGGRTVSDGGSRASAPVSEKSAFFVAESASSVSRSSGIPGSTQPQHASHIDLSTDALPRFLEALEVGNEAICREILGAVWSTTGSVASMAEQFITPAFRQVGERWGGGAVEVFQERRACEICSRMLHEFRKLLPAPTADSPLALGGAPAGDQYTLPSQLIELVLIEQGWRGMNLGNNLPLPTIAAAVRIHRPSMLWLSVSHLDAPHEFAEQYQALRTELPADLPIVIGGRALTDHLRPQLAYTGYCDNLHQLAALASALRRSN